MTAEKCNCEAIREALGPAKPEHLIGGHEPDCVATNEVMRANRGLKRAAFSAADLEPAPTAHRWWLCPGCHGVVDLGPQPPPSPRAPRCTLCSAFCAPCNPDRDPRPLPPGGAA